MICKNCGNDVSEGERVCPRCGAEVSRVVAAPNLQSDAVTLRSMSLPVTPGASVPTQVRAVGPLLYLLAAVCNAVLITFWFTGWGSAPAARYEGAGWVNTVTVILCAASGLIALLCGLTPLGKKPRRALLGVQLAAALWTLCCFWVAVIPGLSQRGLDLQGWIFAIVSLGLLALLVWMTVWPGKKKR